MKSNESTYALLVRSEEKSRGMLEVVLYDLFILSAVVSIWQFVREPITLPAAGLTSATTNIACLTGNCTDLKG